MVAATPGVLVSEKFAGVPTPLAVAVTVYEPEMVLAVNAGAVATPLALVVTVGLPPNVPEAPEPGAANVTLAPGTGLENASRTIAWSAVANAVLTVLLCGVPADVTMLAATPGVFVRLNETEDKPGIDAVTRYEPAIVFAVNVGAVACPAASVNTTFDPLKLPDAPLPGGVNVTCTPCTGALPAVVTNT
jgi:hypothetical protein